MPSVRSCPVGGGRPPPIQVSVLGAVEVLVGAPPRELRSTHQRLLLVRLALANGRPVSADRLIDDLWPRTRPRDATHALQAHVSRLRRWLPPSSLEAGPGGYRLAPDGLHVDAFQFATLYDEGVDALGRDQPEAALHAFDEALALWRGDPLDGLPDSDELRPFLVRLTEMRRTAVAHRIECHLARGTAEAVLPDLRLAVEQDPLDERGWRQLLLALHQTGQSHRALEAYRDAHRMFVDELGVEPSATLRRVHQGILEGAPSAPTPISATAATAGAEVGGPNARPPVVEAERRLTGRVQEMRMLERAWARSASANTIVLLTGEAGIGKTRLATDFTAQAKASGVRVLTARCEQMHRGPYGAISQLVHSVAEDPRHARTAAELLAGVFPDLQGGIDLAAAAPSWDPQVDQHRTMDLIVRWFASMAATGPTIVMIDDVHWADEQSLLFLEHLARTPRPLGVLVLLTARVSEPDHLRDFPALRRQSPAVTRIRLRPLESAQSARLLQAEAEAAASDVRLPDRVVSWGASLSGGNPLFIVELARRLAVGTATGSLAGPSLTMTELGVEDVIRTRLEPLPDGVQQLLENAAILGAEFDPTLLQLMSGLAENEVDAMLTIAGQHDLVGAVPDGSTLAFRHEIVRAVLYESLPPLRRAAGHWRAVGALETRYAGELATVGAELAHHCERSRGREAVDRAVKYHHIAGADAMQRRAPAVAVEHLHRAVDLLPASAENVQRCDLLTALGQAELRAAEPTYRETLLDAARLATEMGDRQRLARAVVANSRGWWSRTGDLDHERVATIEHALRVCDPADRPLRVRLLCAWARETVRDPSRRELVLERSRQALAEAEAIGDESLLATTLASRYTVLYASLGDTSECLQLNERLLEIAHRRGDPGLRLSATVGLTQSATTLGELAIADRYLEQAAQLSESLGQSTRLWLVRGWQAMRHALGGDLIEAERLVERTRDLGVRTRQPDAATWFAGQMFTLRLLQGRLPELLEDVSTQATTHVRGIPAWRAAMALTLAHAGEREESERIVEELAQDDFAALPRDILWLQGMSYLTGACALLGRDDLAGALYTELAPYSGHLAHNGTIDAGPVDLHLGVLARLTGAETVAGHHLAAARRLCRRIGAPLWLARVDQPLTVH